MNNQFEFSTGLSKMIVQFELDLKGRISKRFIKFRDVSLLIRQPSMNVIALVVVVGFVFGSVYAFAGGQAFQRPPATIAGIWIAILAFVHGYIGLNFQGPAYLVGLLATLFLLYIGIYFLAIRDEERGANGEHL